MKIKEQIEARLDGARLDLKEWQNIYASRRGAWVVRGYEGGSEVERAREKCENLKVEIDILEWVLLK